MTLSLCFGKLNGGGPSQAEGGTRDLKSYSGIRNMSFAVQVVTSRKKPTDLNPSDRPRRQTAQLWQRFQTRPADHL